MQLYELELTRGISQVQVIVLFTKFDQFKRDIKMKLEDQHDSDYAEIHIDAEVKRVFEQHYLASLNLNGSPPFIRLESENFVTDEPIFSNFCPAGMHRPGQRCPGLIELTANLLSGGVVAPMLAAVQKDNSEVSIDHVIKR